MTASHQTFSVGAVQIHKSDDGWNVRSCDAHQRMATGDVDDCSRL